MSANPKTRTKTVAGVEYTISEAHPLADVWPWMSDDELREMADDIQRSGQKAAIKKLPDGCIIDGRNRELACKMAGVEPRCELTRLAESEIPAFIRSTNLHRRHLSAEQKRAVIATALLSDAAKSNRSIATVTGASDKTVAAVRERMESTAEIPQLGATTGRDGRTRTAKPSKLSPVESASAKAVKLLAALRKALIEVESEKGIARVTMAAKNNGVQVWQGDEGIRYTLLDDIGTMLTELGAKS